jgi:hypothetical protein
MRKVVVLLLAFSLRGQTQLSPDLEALTKIRTRMNFNLDHQPNYTCVETIERFSRPKTTHKLKVVDTLRLEVALVEGREMFAWPGSKKFDDSDVTQMVTSGAIGNGNFGIHAKALFASRAATFHFLGEEDFQGKKALRFDYKITQMLSGYHIRVGAQSAVVGYHGLFYANPNTFDVERIEVIADQIPVELTLSSVDDKIDYSMTHIGEGDFLLPSQSELSMIGLEGGEERNHVRFTSCRQFSGESVVTFDEAPLTKPDSAPIPTREFDLPAGLELELETTKDIDLKTSAIGDPVYARVHRDVKQKGEIVIPKGATATGRIVRMEKSDNYSILGVEFPEIEAPGILARMKGELSRTFGVAAPNGHRSFARRLLPGEGLIPVNAYQHRIAHGCIMFWRT